MADELMSGEDCYKFRRRILDILDVTVSAPIEEGE
jgi:hypothetical protein